MDNISSSKAKVVTKNDFKYCRSCYNHLAGYVGVMLTEAMETQGYLRKVEQAYDITDKGWDWLSELNILKTDFDKIKRPLTRQCIDGTERRPHLAGALGDTILEKLLENGWLKKVPSSRALTIAPSKQKALYQYFGIENK